MRSTGRSRLLEEGLHLRCDASYRFGAAVRVHAAWVGRGAVVVAVELDPAAVRQHLFQRGSAGLEAAEAFAAAHEQDVGVDGAEVVEGAGELGYDGAFG